MIRRCLLTAAVAIALATTAAHAQVFAVESGPRASGDRWMFDMGGQLAQPVGDFRTQIDRAWGFGAAVRYHSRWFAPLGLRADFGFLNYGNERLRVPVSGTVNRVLVNMNTTNNIALVSGGPELMLARGPIQPYVYAFAGYSYFFTESSVGDNGDGGAFASSTNFSDGGLATGWGGGVRIPLRAHKVGVSIDAGARLTRNGTRSYLRHGDIIDQPDGSLQFNERRTVADFWQYHVGVSVATRGR